MREDTGVLLLARPAWRACNRLTRDCALIVTFTRDCTLLVTALLSGLAGGSTCSPRSRCPSSRQPPSSSSPRRRTRNSWRRRPSLPCSSSPRVVSILKSVWVRPAHHGDSDMHTALAQRTPPCTHRRRGDTSSSEASRPSWRGSCVMRHSTKRGTNLKVWFVVLLWNHRRLGRIPRTAAPAPPTAAGTRQPRVQRETNPTEGPSTSTTIRHMIRHPSFMYHDDTSFL